MANVRASDPWHYVCRGSVLLTCVALLVQGPRTHVLDKARMCWKCFKEGQVALLVIGLVLNNVFQVFGPCT